MSVLFGIVIVVLICLVAVLALHQSRRIAEKSFSTLDSLHKRQSEQLDKTLDRLMTIRWEDLVALQSFAEGETGAFIPPEDQDKGEDQEQDTRWAHLKRLGPGALDLNEEEKALLSEDFA